MPRTKGATLFARLLLHCPASVRPFFDAAAATTAAAASGDALLLHLLATWARDLFDATAQAAERKLGAMAFAAALALPVPGVLDLFDELVAHVTGVFLSLEEAGLDSPDDFGGELFSVLLSAAADMPAAVEDPSVTISREAQGARPSCRCCSLSCSARPPTCPPPWRTLP